MRPCAHADYEKLMLHVILQRALAALKSPRTTTVKQLNRDLDWLVGLTDAIHSDDLEWNDKV